MEDNGQRAVDASDGDEKQQAMGGLELTLSQQLQQKGWACYTNIVSERLCVTIVTRKGAKLEVVGGLGMAAARNVEKVLGAVLPLKISPMSASEVGFTNAWIIRTKQATTYAKVRDQIREVCNAGAKDEAGNWYINFKYTKPAHKMTFSEFMELDEEDLPASYEVLADNERQSARLLKRGLVKEGQLYKKCPVEESIDLDQILASMAAELRYENDVDVNKTVVVLDKQTMGPMEALRLDINSLGEKANDFLYAGGTVKSKKSLNKVSGWFPEGEALSPSEFLARVIASIGREGPTVFDGYRSARELALGLMNSRRAQIKVEGGTLTYTARPRDV